MITTLVPDLYLRNGRSLLRVTPEQASRLHGAARNHLWATVGDARSLRDLKLHDVNGKEIAHVSFNGRVWLNSPDRRKDIEIPLAGFKTAAQHDAEGWADYKIKVACAS